MKAKVVRVKSSAIETSSVSNYDPQVHYTLIDSNFLMPNTQITFDLYTKDDHIYVLFYTKGSLVDEPLALEIALKSDFFILSDELRAFHSYVNDNITDILKNSSLPLEERSKAVYNVSTDIVENMFKNPLSPENLKRSEQAVSGIIDIVLKNEKALLSLMKVTAHDYRTHTHCINVAIYAINIAQSLDFSPKELQELGTAAMLHDLGKTHVDAVIINKNGKLTLEEFDVMKTHPQEGYNIALELGITNENILYGIRDHHEKFDGSGYPRALKSDHISLYAQIISICDVFDALTTERPYKKAHTTFDALKLMKEEFSTHLNMDILVHFIRHLYTSTHTH